MDTHFLPALRRLRTRSRLTALAIAMGVALTAATLDGRQPAAAPAQPPATPPKPLFSSADPVRSCESLKAVVLPGTTIDSAAVDPGDGRTPPSCRVTATVTHPPAGDQIKVFIGLPMKGWNGRFQGTGGGGFSGGSAGNLRQPLALGYAAGATDTGHEGGSGSFALDAKGRLNWQSIRDNAYLGIHEMTVTGKALTQEFYGNAPRYSYFNGCSTGGRQGLSEAQRYPADYHGILAGAPAINWTKLHPEQLWGAVVMNESKNVVANCKFDAAVAAAVAACDSMDEVKDGVIEDPHRCTYDPKALIGTSAGECGTITEADIDVIRKIWEGPKRRDGSFLWYGLPKGAPFVLSATGGAPLAPRPFGITLDWFKYFLAQDPAWDFMTLTPAGYELLWDQSVEQFSDVLATDNSDLSGFRDHGGKLILWHGYADPLIYADGTIEYYKRVQQQMGGPEKTAQFVRLFMAPGVGHCGGGNGPAPTGQFEAVVKWVEEGQAPETLQAVARNQRGEVVRTRPLCQYPLVAHYTAKFSTDDAASFECKPDSQYEPRVGQPGKDVVWVPSPEATVEKMLDVAKVTPQDFVVDLGSGDGRNVIAAARRGARALGVEYNPDMVELSKRNAQQAGVAQKATFVQGDMYAAEFSDATVLALFLLPDNLKKLRPKFADLKPGTRIVANTFGIEGWTAEEEVTLSQDCTSWCTVILYIVPANVDGAWKTPQGTLALKQSFQTVSGTLGSAPLENVKLRGDQLTFTAGGAAYSARVAGDAMKGTSKSGASETVWSAARIR